MSWRASARAGAVLDVAEAVVGSRARRRAVLGEEGERAFDERGDGRCFLVVVQLDVREPRVVVDDRVRVVVADLVSGRIQPPLRCERSPVTRWPGPKAHSGCVHVQQIAGAGPLERCRSLGGRARRGGAVTAEDLPDGRVGEAGRARNQARPPARLAAAIADPLLQLSCSSLGAARTTRATRPEGCRPPSASDATNDAPSPATR